MDKHTLKLLKITLTSLLLLILFFVIVIGKNFLYPLVLAILLAYLLYPVVQFFERKLKMSRLLSSLLSILFGLIVIIAIGDVILIQIKVFVKDFSAIKAQSIANFNSLQTFIESKFKFPVKDQEEWLRAQIVNFLDSSNDFFKNIFKILTGTVGRLAFIPIYTFFMLYYRERAKNFILKVSKNNENLTEGLLEQISKVTIKYITGVLTVSSILAVSHSVVLSIIGVKYAVFLGILAASISIIPYFGTLASSLIPLSFSLILSDNFYQPLWIIGYFLVINSIENNILTPTITGGNVNLNPFITILGLILGGTIWGIPGMIIIIPTLGVIKIICDSFPELEPYGYILGIERKQRKRIKNRKDEDDLGN